VSNIWGEISCKLENDSGTVTLEHSILEPNFYEPETIIHESVITGRRTYSKDSRYSEFIITEYLFKYSDPISIANQLLGLENTIVLFTPGELMWSKHCIITVVDIFPLVEPYRYDIAMIKMIALNNAVLGDYIRKLNGTIVTALDGTKLRRKIRGIE